MPSFYIANTEILLSAIRSTGASASQIARVGKLSRDTMQKARNGKRISEAKAGGIYKGLKESGADPLPLFEEVFTEEVAKA